MNVMLKNRVIEIELEPLERLWSCHLSGRIEIPLEDVKQVWVEKRPEWHWQELRAPGTYVPGVIKAGTYYSKLGRAFWSVQGDADCLGLELTTGYYKRVVLGSAQAEQWRVEIQSALPG